MLLQKYSEWDSTDAANLKAFLSTETAEKAFAIVADMAPSLLDGGDVNKTLVRSGEVKGYAAAISNLFELVTKKPESQPVSETYPDLDNDALWPKSQPVS